MSDGSNEAADERKRRVVLTNELQGVVFKHGLDPELTLAALIPIVADQEARFSMRELEGRLTRVPTREEILKEAEADMDRFRNAVLGTILEALQQR